MKVTNMSDEEDKTLMTGNANSGRMPNRAPTATIEEVDENGIDEEEDSLTILAVDKLKGTETPLIGKGTAGTLVRVATYASSLNQPTGGSRQGSTRSRYRAGPQGRKHRKRVIFKNGECNVFQSHISQRRLRYLQDIFTTLVDTQWRWTLLVFALSFILSWLVFATIWWLIAFTHGDLEEHDDDWKPCVVALHSFASCFLFSIETQHTIGYGSRSTTEECPEAIFIMCLQSITGVMIQAFMVGIVFAKMARPKQRTQTLLFSRNAVICQRDGSLCLMFRVGDMRKSHIIGASIRAQLIKTCQTQEGEILSQAQCELEVGTDYGSSDLFFVWPMTVVHRINSNSPLYRTSACELIERDRFEIVVILEGTIESTGQTTQARSSYLASEILWGHRFEPIVSYNKERQSYEVNYSKFNNTYNVDTPLCSAKELDEFYRMQQGLRQPADIMGGISRCSTYSNMLSYDDTPTIGPSLASISYPAMQLSNQTLLLSSQNTPRNSFILNNHLKPSAEKTQLLNRTHTAPLLNPTSLENPPGVIPTVQVTAPTTRPTPSVPTRSTSTPNHLAVPPRFTHAVNNIKKHSRDSSITRSASCVRFNLEEETMKQNRRNSLLKHLPNDFDGDLDSVETPLISSLEKSASIKKSEKPLVNGDIQDGRPCSYVTLNLDDERSSVKESSL